MTSGVGTVGPMLKNPPFMSGLLTLRERPSLPNRVLHKDTLIGKSTNEEMTLKSV